MSWVYPMFYIFYNFLQKIIKKVEYLCYYWYNLNISIKGDFYDENYFNKYLSSIIYLVYLAASIPTLFPVFRSCQVFSNFNPIECV